MTNNVKNIKKSILGLLALVMAFGLALTVSAFKVNPETGNRDTLVFQYTGTSFGETDYESAANWIPTEDMSDCDGSGNICKLAIDENELSGIGTLSEQLADYLENLGGSGASGYVNTPANRVADRD